MVKTDYDGNIVWSKKIPGSQWIFNEDRFYSWVYKSDTVVLLKFDTAGNFIWAKDLSETICPRFANKKSRIQGVVANQDRINISSVQYDSLGVYGFGGLLTLDTAGNYIHGWCDSYGGSGSSITHYIRDGFPAINGAWFKVLYLGISYHEVLWKINYDGSIDSTGNEIEFIAGPNNTVEEILKLPGNGFIGIGQSSDNGGNPASLDIVLSRFNESAHMSWKKYFANAADTGYWFRAGTCDSLGNVYLIASTTDGNCMCPGPNVFIRTDPNGNVISSKSWDQASPFYANNMFYRNGHLYVFGQYFNGTQYVGSILVTDTLFNQCAFSDSAWAVQLSSVALNSGLLFPLPQSTYSVAGYTYVDSSTTISSATADLCLELSVSEKSQTNPPRFIPNPFRTGVEIQLVAGKQFSVEIFAITGQLLFKDQFSETRAEIDLTDLPAGIYTARVTAGSFVHSQKIVKVD